jgi:hypothetical protein
MAGLVAAIHVSSPLGAVKTWMLGTRPGMTKEIYQYIVYDCGETAIFRAKSPRAQKNLRRLSTLKIRVKWRLRI